MKALYLLAALGLSILCLKPIHAQNTGYGGKRFLLKTNVINGVKSPAFSLELEYAFSRHMTFSIKGGLYQYKINQRYNPGEYKTRVNPDWGPSYNQSDEALSGEGRTRLPDKADINSREAEIELRYYFGRIIPAPKGFFSSFSLRYVNMDVKGNYYNSLQTDLGYRDYDYEWRFNPEYYYSYEVTNINCVGYRLGAGYQNIWKGLISYGFKATFDHTFFNITDAGDDKILSGVAKNFGSNVTTFSNLQYGYRKTSSFFSYGRSKSSTPTTMSIGLSVSVQVGILF